MKLSHRPAVRIFALGTLVSLLSLWGTGCGEKMGPTVEVAGKVTLDGKPFSEGSIWFSSARSGAGFHTNLKPDGQYSVKVLDVQLGETYGVFIGGLEPADPNELDPSGNPKGIPVPPVPAKYREARTSGLTAVIDKPGQVTFDFDLKSQ